MTTNNTRDPIDVTIGWTLAACVMTLLIVASIAAPLLYVWTLGICIAVGTLALTLTIGGSLTSSGSFFDAVVGYQVIEGGFRLIGVIVLALANVSSSD